MNRLFIQTIENIDTNMGLKSPICFFSAPAGETAELQAQKTSNIQEVGFFFL